VIAIESYQHWRDTARELVLDDVPPAEVRLETVGDQPLLFDIESSSYARQSVGLPRHPPSGDGSYKKRFTVPPTFLDLAAEVAFHRSDQRWNLLYRMLWRITHGQRSLLEIETDDDVLAARKLEKEVRRDAHKMKAFVRFRRVLDGGREHYIAWHRPDHRIVRKIAPFFSRRFQDMDWTILTPDESVSWEQRSLRYGPGVARSEAPAADELEDLWRTYYGSIFNPARIKLKAMRAEMPARHWATLPETDLIPELLLSAPKRVETMVANREGYEATAADFLTKFERPPASLAELAARAESCQACDLYRDATQVVFGSGPADAKIVMVGEQPGDHEDRQGEPFVGPAGKILDQALQAAGIDRDLVYVTNTVKHFKHKVIDRGKRRLHQKPNAREIRSCKPWFDAEWEYLPEAQVLVCLGATAAQAIIGRDFRITRQRGEFVETSYTSKTLATWHPSAILRVPDRSAAQVKQQELVEDLKKAAGVLQV